MKIIKNLKFCAILLTTAILPSNVNAANYDLSSYNGTSYIEGLGETDGTASLAGVHIITYVDSQSGVKPYVGGGIVTVSLPDQNDSFVALHAVLGTDFKLTEHIALNFETGIDFGEELIADDEGNQPANDNQVDYNVAAGLKIDFNSSLYVKGYVRYHAFDGIYLPPTDVVFFGGRLGLSF